jgi:hypothetical protein
VPVTARPLLPFPEPTYVSDLEGLCRDLQHRAERRSAEHPGPPARRNQGPREYVQKPGVAYVDRCGTDAGLLGRTAQFPSSDRLARSVVAAGLH